MPCHRDPEKSQLCHSLETAAARRARPTWVLLCVEKHKPCNSMSWFHGSFLVSQNRVCKQHKKRSRCSCLDKRFFFFFSLILLAHFKQYKLCFKKKSLSTQYLKVASQSGAAYGNLQQLKSIHNPCFASFFSSLLTRSGKPIGLTMIHHMSFNFDTMRHDGSNTKQVCYSSIRTFAK